METIGCKIILRKVGQKLFCTHLIEMSYLIKWLW